MLFVWALAMSARTALYTHTSGRPLYPLPNWIRDVVYGVGTRSVLAWSLALLALVPFELLLLLSFESNERDVLLWISWLYVGLVLISPRKTPVVFLRRFGLTRSNDITRRAFSRYLRGR